MRNHGFRRHVAPFFLAMTADNIEHVISHRMVFQKFYSPALGGCAVIAHWRWRVGRPRVRAAALPMDA